MDYAKQNQANRIKQLLKEIENYTGKQALYATNSNGSCMLQADVGLPHQNVDFTHPEHLLMHICSEFHNLKFIDEHMNFHNHQAYKELDMQQRENFQFIQDELLDFASKEGFKGKKTHNEISGAICSYDCFNGIASIDLRYTYELTDTAYAETFTSLTKELANKYDLYSDDFTTSYNKIVEIAFVLLNWECE